MTKWKYAVAATFTMLTFLLASCTQVLPQESTNAQVTTDSASQTVRTEKEYKALTTAYEKVQTDLTAAQAWNRDLQVEYDKMKADLSAAQTQSKNLQAEHEKAKTDLSATQAQNKSLQAQYDKIKADVDAMQTQNQNLQMEYDITKADLAIAQERLQRITAIQTGAGVRIEQGNMAVTLHSFSQYKETDSYYLGQLHSGYGYYVADLTVANNSKDKTISYGRTNPQVQTGEGFKYEYTMTSAMKQIATLGDLPPGETARFVVSFAIPQSAKPTKLTYKAYPGTGAIGFIFELDTTITSPPNTPVIITPAVVTVPASTPVPTVSPTPSNSPSQTPLKVEIETLTSAYRSNPVRAKDEYVGKLIEVSGQVFSLGEGFFGGLYVSIAEDHLSTLSSFSNITAELADNETNRNIVKELYKGQKVTFIGVIGRFGMEGTVYLKPTSIKYSSLLPKVGK